MTNYLDNLLQNRAEHMYHFTLTTELNTPASAVWEHASSMVGVNQELAPFLQMTYPPQQSMLTATLVPLNVRLFRSWILLFGVLPIEYDDLTFTALQDGHSFQEDSTMLLIARWQHQRVVTPTPSGCTLQDTIAFMPRVWVLGALLHAIYLGVFRYRHRRLVQLFLQR